MDRNPQVIVAYSHNVSQAIRVHKLPRPGETIRALQASAGMDGAKGTNTAVACSRVGARVAMVAHVKGGDWYYKGQQVLKEAQIDDTYVILGEGIKDTSGVVLIDDEGNNMIVLGAHNEQTIPDEEIDQALTAMKDAQYCVTGYEINEKSVRHILRKARELGIKTVVNPSPIPDFVPDYWGDISLLIHQQLSHGGGGGGNLRAEGLKYKLKIEENGSHSGAAGRWTFEGPAVGRGAVASVFV